MSKTVQIYTITIALFIIIPLEDHYKFTILWRDVIKRNKLLLHESKHTIVCHAAQEAGTPHRGYIDRKKENVIFTPLYLGDPLSDWNKLCCRVARQLGESTFQSCRKSSQPFPRYKRPKFQFFSSSFCTLCKNCYKTQMRYPIAVK